MGNLREMKNLVSCILYLLVSICGVIGTTKIQGQ